MCEEVVVALFAVLARYLSGGREEHNEKPDLEQLLSRQRFEPSIYRIRATSLTSFSSRFYWCKTRENSTITLIVCYISFCVINFHCFLSYSFPVLHVIE
jgi:hypothetical protein